MVGMFESHLTVGTNTVSSIKNLPCKYGFCIAHITCYSLHHQRISWVWLGWLFFARYEMWYYHITMACELWFPYLLCTNTDGKTSHQNTLLWNLWNAHMTWLAYKREFYPQTNWSAGVITRETRPKDKFFMSEE